MQWPWNTSSKLRALQASLNRIEQNTRTIMTDQDTLNAIATRIEADVTGEGAALDTIKTGIATLEAAANSGQPLDFTTVNQAVADLDSKLTDIQGVATALPPTP